MLICQSLVFIYFTWFSLTDGHDVSTGRYPYHVIIRSGHEHICSGSIINTRHILTAHSCVIGYSARDLHIVAGTHSLNRNGSPYKIGTIIHPDNTNDDIALLRTLHDIHFNSNIQPIKITSYDYKRDGYPMTMTAFKKPPSGAPPFTDKLQVYNYQINRGYQCIGQYIGVSDKFICLIKSDRERVCNADFGGAIVANNYIIGIKIPGERCVGNRPEVHLRVKYYSSWIQENSDLITKNVWHYSHFHDYDNYDFPFKSSLFYR